MLPQNADNTPRKYAVGQNTMTFLGFSVKELDDPINWVKDKYNGFHEWFTARSFV